MNSCPSVGVCAPEFKEALWKWLLVWCEPGETRAARLEIAFSVFKAAGVASMLYLAEHLGVLGVGGKGRQRINKLYPLILS